MAEMGQKLPFRIPIRQRLCIQKPRAHHHGFLGRLLQEPGKILRLVGKVAIHRDELFISAVIGVLKNGLMGRADSRYPGSMEDPDRRIASGDSVQNLGRTIRGIVVHKEQFQGKREFPEPGNHGLDVLCLI